MGIQIDPARVHMTTKNTSYVIEVFEGELIHSYWGKKIELPDISPIIPVENKCSFYPNPNTMNRTYSLDILPREFPDFGRSDYRNPQVKLQLNDGTTVSHFEMVSFMLLKEKPNIKGLPSTYAEVGDKVMTLQVVMTDSKSGLDAELYYTVYEDFDIITRHVVFHNQGSDTVVLDHALSANVDFYNDNDFEMIHFNGSWARERQVKRVPVGNTTHLVESKRGASGHIENPLVLLARPGTDDLKGEVYGMNFVYSGNFKCVVEVNSFNTTRFQMGINDFDFSWQLKPGEKFYTPEVVMTYACEGFNELSYNYHELYKQRLCRGKYRDLERPILINNWEATYFDFDEQKLKDIVKVADALDLELFVLDDGWFGLRNSDETGLGDWFVNKEKLPEGLTGISQFANERDIKFGLWFEPEMVSPDSDLYRKHPDWCLHVEGHTRSQSRNQLILDMSREDVQTYIIDSISDILSAYPIEYVKWDMNRNMTEVGSAILPPDRQQEVSHRYILGLYKVLENLTTKYEHILFESCSGGGGRFDPGMLYYMPQTWTSDDTDAHERIGIQYGTSFAYPQITMGAHVSESPNHQVGRITCLERRALTSMMANLGFELDLSAMSDTSKAKVLEYVTFYKGIRRDIQFGRLYRLMYDEMNMTVMIESEDKRRYYLFHYRGLNKPNLARKTVPLKYVSDGKYKVEVVRIGNDEAIYDQASIMLNEMGDRNNQITEDDLVYDASYLNHKGYTFNEQAYDFDAQLIIFTQK